jgi:tetratricopeptide (TPR) repeat protein
MEVFQELGNDAGLARAWLVVGNAHNQVGEEVAMYEAAQRAIEHARRAGDVRHEVWARTLLSSAMTWGPLPVNEGLRVAQDLLARSSGSPLLTASALRVMGNLKALQGAFDEARGLAARIIAINEEFGRPVAVATNLAFLSGQIEGIAQNWAEAERLLRRSSEMLEEMGEHGWLSTIVAQRANALIELGRDDEAYRCTERSEELSAPDDQASQVMWRVNRAKVLARRGKSGEAMDLARAGVEIADSTEGVVWQADAYVALADVARSNGDRAEEERALREALRRYEAKGALGSLEPVRRRLGSLP